MHNILIILSMFFANILLGQQPIEETLKDHFTKLTKIECRYKQEKQLSMINTPLISTGIFKYEKGGEVLLEQKTPFKKIHQINENSDNKFDKYINQFIMSILNGDILDNKNLEVIYSENKNDYILIITPKKGGMRKRIKELKLTFSKKIISLNKIEIILGNSDITKISFYDK